MDAATPDTTKPRDEKPASQWKCRACGKVTLFSALILDSRRPVWTCSDAFCGGICDRVKDPEESTYQTDPERSGLVFLDEGEQA